MLAIPSRRLRSRSAAAHRVRARMARCSTRGPCAGVRRGRHARRGVGRDADSFSMGQDAPSKSPAPPHGLARHGEGMDARVEATEERLPDARQAPSGVVSLLLRASCPTPFGPALPFAPLLRRSGYFSLATQRKVTRPPKEDESSCFTPHPNKAKHRTRLTVRKRG